MKGGLKCFRWPAIKDEKLDRWKYVKIKQKREVKAD